MDVIIAKSKPLGSGDKDEICRICFIWVTSRSKCSNRYWQLQGEWNNEIPKDERLTPIQEEEDGILYKIATVPICNTCFDKQNIDKKRQIWILGELFNIDNYYRMND